VLGGSSSINGMVYVRGHARDFDHWAEQGATGWAFADVLPYFKRMEHATGGEDGWRGTNGPLARATRPRQNPLYSSLRRGGPTGRLRDDGRLQRLQAGRLWSPMEQTIHDGRRWSTANAYLRPALKRKNVSRQRLRTARRHRESTRRGRRNSSFAKRFRSLRQNVR
jgi:choline dehydrogenase